MKIRLFALILVVCMIIGFSACDNPTADSGENSFDSNPVGDNEESTGDQNGSEDIIVPEEGSRDPETNVTDDTDNDNNWIEEISLRQAINQLSEREKHILSLRFFAGKTQVEVASEVGISQAQVSRLEKSALTQIKKHL